MKNAIKPLIGIILLLAGLILVCNGVLYYRGLVWEDRVLQHYRQTKELVYEHVPEMAWVGRFSVEEVVIDEPTGPSSIIFTPISVKVKPNWGKEKWLKGYTISKINGNVIETRIRLN